MNGPKQRRVRSVPIDTTLPPHLQIADAERRLREQESTPLVRAARFLSRDAGVPRWLWYAVLLASLSRLSDRAGELLRWLS